MPLVRKKNGYEICFGNNETSAQCGFQTGEICNGCEDFIVSRLNDDVIRHDRNGKRNVLEEKEGA